MGRLTPSFRTVYSEVFDDLRKEMRNCFVDVTHKDAFDLLYKEAWRPEEAAMGNSTLPTVLDKLCWLQTSIPENWLNLRKQKLKLRRLKFKHFQN